MRIVGVLALAACFLNIAFAKDRIKKQKDIFSDESTNHESSIDPRSSNWVPVVLRRHGYDDNGPRHGNGYNRPQSNYDNNGPRNNYDNNGPRNNYENNAPRNNYDNNGPRNNYDNNGPQKNYDSNGPQDGYDSNGPRHGYGDNVKSINRDIDYPVMRNNLAVGPPRYRSQNMLYDPVGKAYVKVEMEHPIYHGRTLPSISGAAQAVAPSRPSSGLITVTSNTDRYTDGSYGSQGQGSITPLALGSDYSSGTSGSNVNTGYNDSPAQNYPGYQSSAYTDVSSQSAGPSSDYSNSPSASGNGYGSYENNYDVSSNYQSGPISDDGYQTGAYAPTPGSYGGYTPSPAPSSGYVGYGGTFHNYGQHVSYPVAYRGRLPQLFGVVVGSYGTPWAANQVEQETGYYLYR